MERAWAYAAGVSAAAGCTGAAAACDAHWRQWLSGLFAAAGAGAAPAPAPAPAAPSTPAGAPRGRSPEALLAGLEAGGEASAGVLVPVLEHAIAVLESQASRDVHSRSSRKASRRIVGRAEGALDRLQEGPSLCDSIARVRRGELAEVCSLMAVVGRASAADTPDDLRVVLEALLDSLDRCADPVLGAVSVLEGPGPSAHTAPALAALAALPLPPLPQPNPDECGAVAAILKLTPVSPSRSAAERVAAWMATYAIAVRNGFAVAASAPLCDCVRERWIPLLQEANSADARRVDETMRVASAHRAVHLATCQAISNAPAELGPPLEDALMKDLRSIFSQFTSYSKAVVRGAVSASSEIILRGQDVALAIGACAACQELVVFRSPAASESALQVGAFAAGLTLLRRACPAVPQPSWWVERMGTVDARCVELWGVWTLLGSCHILGNSEPAQTWMKCDWWQPALDHAVQTLRANELAGRLMQEDERRAVHFGAVHHAAMVVEAAAAESSQHGFLLGCGVSSALTHAVLHDLSFIGLSIKAPATSALVALLGKREDSALDAAVIEHVVGSFCDCFDRRRWQHTLTVSSVLVHARHLAVLLVADAHKRSIMECPSRLVGALAAGLCLDPEDPRTQHRKVDTLREICAAALLELAMVAEGADALRQHRKAVLTLERLAAEGQGKARACAEQVLLALADAPGVDGTGSTSPGAVREHVMISHCWNDQAVVMRIAAALLSRGYRVSVDGGVDHSTADATRQAVQNAAAVLIAVSKEYRGSALCRAEAQRAQDAGVPLLPLMVQQYQPDGWLKRLLGSKTRLSFAERTLESAEAFEARMDELTKALGSLGKADSPAPQSREPRGRTHAKRAKGNTRAEDIGRQLLESEQARAAALAHGLEHVIALVGRASADRSQSLRQRKARSRLRARAITLFDDVTAGPDSVLCAGSWAADVATSTAALLSEVLALDDLRADRRTDSVEFLVSFLHKLSEIRKGRVSVWTQRIYQGGQRCAQSLSAALDHAMQVLDEMALATPHGSPTRTQLLSLSTHAAVAALEHFDAPWCDRLAVACRADESLVREVSELAAKVEGLEAGAQAAATLSAFIDALQLAVQGNKAGAPHRSNGVGPHDDAHSSPAAGAAGWEERSARRKFEEQTPQLLRRLCRDSWIEEGGSKSQLVARLVEYESLVKDDVRYLELQRMIDDTDPGAPPAFSQSSDMTPGAEATPGGEGAAGTEAEELRRLEARASSPASRGVI